MGGGLTQSQVFITIFQSEIKNRFPTLTGTYLASQDAQDEDEDEDEEMKR